LGHILPFATTDHFHYDQAGRLWRTNASDGIDKIALYDCQQAVSRLDPAVTVIPAKAGIQRRCILDSRLRGNDG
jgi:hypothetical protein